jgi:hypothetical protein
MRILIETVNAYGEAPSTLARFRAKLSTHRARACASTSSASKVECPFCETFQNTIFKGKPIFVQGGEWLSTLLGRASRLFKAFH